MLRLFRLPIALPLALLIVGFCPSAIAQPEGILRVQRKAGAVRIAQAVWPELDHRALMADKSTFRTKIKRRAGRTPIIEVTFNGSHSFEMIVDTGANDTVITQRMAAEMGIIPVAKLKFDTASARGVEMSLGRVKLLTVDGAAAKNLLVAIAGPELETGLLGHDFFGNYDITIKQDVVEFRVR